ncbi:MAG: MoaD/ThiS family protein [Aquificaceae bacterium]|nr:MoaD/ThiS family protein [Aquificaceae bacterium]
MRVRLLGYLGYVAGRDILELKDARSVREALESLSELGALRELLYRKEGILWEGVLLILNGRVVKSMEESVGEGSELVITLPTAGG